MTQDVAIKCRNGLDEYQAIITGKDIKVFQAVSQKSSVKNKTGEDLVEAILTTASAGDISQVQRRTMNFQVTMGPDGQPSLEVFDDQGKRTRVEFEEGGCLVRQPLEGQDAANYLSESQKKQIAKKITSAVPGMKVL